MLAAGAALTLSGILTRPAAAAEFDHKLATGQDCTHPVNTRARGALDRIREATGGRLDVQLFPADQPGSDTDLLSQVRGGGVESFDLSTPILATLVPIAGLPDIGFASPDHDAVRRAMDGDLGAHVRGAITKAGLIPVCETYDNGFRHITTSGRPAPRAT